MAFECIVGCSLSRLRQPVGRDRVSPWILHVRRSDKMTTSQGTALERAVWLRSGLRRIAFVMAVPSVLAWCSDSRRFRAGDLDRASDATSPPAQDEAKRTFLEKYAKASARLEAGLSRLHARGRLREFRFKDQQPGEWATLEFFVEDGKLRVDREYGSQDRSAVEDSNRPDAY